MDLDNKKIIITAMIEKLTKSNKRELGLKKELADDNLTFLKVTEMSENSAELPVDCGYENYPEWLDGIEKEINTGIGSLAKVDEQKIEVEALQYYIDNIA